MRAAGELCGQAVEVVHVVGGGARNELLCQLTADACGVPVLAGPVESTALGNVLVQARALGIDLPDLASMRTLLRATQRAGPLRPRSWFGRPLGRGGEAHPRRRTGGEVSGTRHTAT